MKIITQERSLFVCYFICHIFLLINGGIYWDDWTVYNNSAEGIMQQFNGNGLIPVGYLHLFLQSIPFPRFIYSFLTFILSFGSGLLLYRSLLRLMLVNPVYSFAITLFFLILPFNAARQTMICFPYTLCLFLFFVAYYLFLKYIQTPLLYLRILSIVLFFLSFITNSLLVFYIIVPVTVIFLKRRKELKQLNFLLYLDYYIIPILFWMYKSLFLQPSGLYKLGGYNAISNHSLLAVPIMLLKTIKDSLGSLMYGLISSYSEHWILSMFFLLICTLAFIKFYQNTASSIQSKLLLIALGTMLFLIGAFPYTAVGKIPSFKGFDTRHQLLLPVGTAFIIVGLIEMIAFDIGKRILYAFIITGFMLYNYTQYIQYQREWLKELSLIDNFHSNDIVRNNSTFIVTDSLQQYNIEYNIEGGGLRFYAFTGIMQEAFHNQTKFASLNTNFFTLQKNGLRSLLLESEKFKLKNYKESNSYRNIIIRKGKYPLTSYNILKLLFGFYTQVPDNKAKIKDILEVEVEKRVYYLK